MTEITSAENELFKKWKLLDTSRGIRKSGEFFLMGEKLIQEFLHVYNPSIHSPYKIKAEIISEDLHPLTPSFPSANKPRQVPTFKLAKNLFKEIDFIGTHFNLLLLELPELETYNFGTTPQGLELITPLGDPGNLGAILRSALAFGTSKVILTQEAAFPFLPKVIKASAGAVLQIPLLRCGPLTELVGHEVYALDAEGSDIANFRWPRSLRLLVGEEGPGLAGLKGLMKLKIQTGEVESLNASVAASIALYCYRQSLGPSFNKG
ncbi:MAG: RNA methyltransferase [Bdellovibrionaceae bacterium]|nr:RNA methyltransferase [Pseudobdellovibrionaceae bacterium]